ncbi:MAG: metallophosphoesterase [Rickettsiales bacterium]|jgi:aspartate beta-hydroxylase|nr:metallophosphoesterase [Rickettsiales bacterium]
MTDNSIINQGYDSNLYQVILRKLLEIRINQIVKETDGGGDKRKEAKLEKLLAYRGEKEIESSAVDSFVEDKEIQLITDEMPELLPDLGGKLIMGNRSLSANKKTLEKNLDPKEGGQNIIYVTGVDKSGSSGGNHYVAARAFRDLSSGGIVVLYRDSFGGQPGAELRKYIQSQFSGDIRLVSIENQDGVLKQSDSTTCGPRVLATVAVGGLFDRMMDAIQKSGGMDKFIEGNKSKPTIKISMESFQGTKTEKEEEDAPMFKKAPESLVKMNKSVSAESSAKSEKVVIEEKEKEEDKERLKQKEDKEKEVEMKREADNKVLSLTTPTITPTTTPATITTPVKKDDENINNKIGSVKKNNTNTNNNALTTKSREEKEEADKNKEGKEENNNSGNNGDNEAEGDEDVMILLEEIFDDDKTEQKKNKKGETEVKGKREENNGINDSGKKEKEEGGEKEKPVPESSEALKTRVRDIFQPAVEANNKGSEDRKKVNEKIDTLADIIFSGQTTEPDSKAQKNDFVFETDLHGDMKAFLDTLLKNGMVEYNPKNPTGIVFCDPQGNEEYTLGDLEAEKDKLSSEEFTELMDRIQMLPDVVPTEKFKNYINCGDFLDRGGQSEQMIPLVTRLCRKFKGQFPDSRMPTFLTGNHEVFYVDSDKENAIENGGNFLLALDEEQKNKKFKATASLVRKAVYDGTLKLASSKGNTLFSHTVVTKDMVKSLAENLSELSKDPGLAEALWPDAKKLVKKTAKIFRKLDKLIRDNKKFEEKEIRELVSALNNFNILRTKLVERREKFYDESKHLLPYLDGEMKLIDIMSRGGRGSLTWQRRDYTRESDLISGIKYVVGHDAIEFNQKNLGFNNKVFYADTGRSSGYNNGTTKASYFHCDRSAFEGSSFEEGDIKQVKETIGPGDIKKQVEKGWKFFEKSRIKKRNNVKALILKLREKVIMLRKKIVNFGRKIVAFIFKIKFLKRNKNNSEELFQNKKVSKKKARQKKKIMSLQRFGKQFKKLNQVKNNLKFNRFKKNKKNSKKLFQNKKVSKKKARQKSRKLKEQANKLNQIKNNLKLSKLKNITKDLESGYCKGY